MTTCFRANSNRKLVLENTDSTSVIYGHQEGGPGSRCMFMCLKNQETTETGYIVRELSHFMD